MGNSGLVHWYRWHHKNFNSRSPYWEQLDKMVLLQFVLKFQFTLPAWRAIFARIRHTSTRRNFNSRPRVGSDFWGYQSGYTNLFFNSRSSREERCCIPKVVHGLLAISILAPCVGSDSARWSSRCSPRYFNSRSPHGERSSHRALRLHAVDFSIHAPRGETTFDIL